MPNTENNKRIAKNTLILYFRMLLTMLISFYTVRLVWNALGVVDYGIYNVVGGIVIMFSFMSGTMASASQRFFAFDLGRNDIPKLKRTFSLTVTVYLIISVVVFILAETIGLWLLNSYMVIPSDRVEAAKWVYQFAILSFLVSIMAIPFNAVIIARENMAIYAYVSMVEVILKLANVYILLAISVDKLKLYAVLMFAVTCLISIIYIIICKRKYEECCYRFYWSKDQFYSLIGYSGWNMFGAVAGVLNNQGVNVLLNMFFGPAVNAALGVSHQVNASINQFVMSFNTAVKSQITKYYSVGEKDQMISLVFKSSKYSYYVIFILAMPVLLETNYIFILWLKNVSEYIVLFTRLIIINALIDSLSYSLQTAAQATGKIKMYQAVVGGVMLLNIPTAYIVLKLGFQAQAAMYVAIVISIICLFLRLWMLRWLINFSINGYIKKVIIRVLFVSIVAPIVPLFINLRMDGGFARLIIVGLTSLIATLVVIYFVGLNGNERQFFIKLIKYRLIK